MMQCVNSYVSQISQESLLKQAVLNTSQSVELLREAVSNSVDAGAQHIDIKLVGKGGAMWDIVILDDGNGMEERHMMAFFNAGDSQKDYPQKSIGEKGLGSKTTFVAKEIIVESRRYTDATHILVGRMVDPMAALNAGSLPKYTVQLDPAGHVPQTSKHGTRVELRDVHLTSFNGKKTDDSQDIAARLMHYLRSLCATGTVKNRHAAKAHIIGSVMNVGVIPMVTLEVVPFNGTPVTMGPLPGAFDVPSVDLSPSGGPISNGVALNSKKFCDVYDFSRSKTFTIQGASVTVHYDGTIVIAGEQVRAEMLRDELKQGWTQKSRMGVHLCKDFIPLRNDAELSKQLLGDEYYFEYKLFLNCQSFQLNADRNVITNEESDEISWIWNDFKQAVWPTVEARAAVYKQMKALEDGAIDATKKTRQALALKAEYSKSPNVFVGKQGVTLQFVKEPKKEADVSHLLAMLVQSGMWRAELDPIEKFGQYIDASTDVLVENSSGEALLVEIETQLVNLFKHQHPMTSYDLVVVWSLGGLSNGSSNVAPWGANGGTVPVTLLQTAAGGWELKWGTHVKPVIVLQEILA